MKLTISFLVIVMVLFQHVGSAQTVTISGKNLTLHQVFSSIEKQTGYVVLGNKKAFDGAKTVSISATNMPLRQLLDLVLKDQILDYVIQDKTIVVSVKPAPTKLQITVRPGIGTQQVPQDRVNGYVKDSTGSPLSGAVVSVKGKHRAVPTDKEGYFVINASAGDQLVVSFMGYQTATYDIQHDTKIVNFTLSHIVNQNDEVVVTGIFNKSKESYTGATRVITDKDIKEFGGRNIFVTLGNIDPAFYVVPNNAAGSNPNVVPAIQLRGTRNLPNIDQYQTGTNQQLRDQVSAALNAPLVIMDGFQVSMQRMMDLNVNEIMSITLLKDGSATALYGSQGANGVIVITTKQPKAGSLRISYNGSANLNMPDLSSYNILNAKDKLALEVASGYYSNPTKNAAQNLLLEQYYNQVLGLVQQGVNTDWMSKPLKTRVDQNHSLRLEGGDQSFRYSLEGQYNLINGVMKGSKRETANGTVTISYRLKTLNFSNSTRIASMRSNESPWGSFGDYVKLNPYWSPYDSKGHVVQTFSPFLYDYWVQDGFQNPIANPMYDATLNTFNKGGYTSIINNFQLEWRGIKHVTINAAGSINSTQSSSDNFKPASSSAFAQYSAADVFRKGTYDYGTGKQLDYTGRFSATYFNEFKGGHALAMGASADLNQSKTTSYLFSAEGFPDESVDFLANALQYKQNSGPGGNESTTRRIGIVGSANYNFKGRYFSDLTYRLDGASQFGTNKRFAPFYSLGAGWNIHQEKFMQPYSKIVNRLKLRGSYGVTGNQAFSAYQPLATYAYNVGDRYKNWIGATQQSLGNPNLKWQQTNKIDIGLESDLFGNRMTIQADYYHENTSNLLSSLDLPYSNGFTNYVENIGNLTQKGWELLVRVNIIQNDAKRFLWSVTGNITSNKDKIVKLSAAMKAANEQLATLTDQGSSVFTQIIREGASQNTVYAVRSLGIDPSTGKELFLNRLGGVTYTWDARDRVAVGLLQPKYRGNFSTMVRYQGFTFNASFGYRFGGQLYNQTLIDRIENVDRFFNVDSRVFYNRWQKPGDIAAFRGLNETTKINVSSRFIQNESTLTCQNVNMSYDIDPSKLRRYGIKILTVGVNTGELFYISTVKQERGINYPFSRQVTGSLYVTF